MPTSTSKPPAISTPGADPQPTVTTSGGSVTATLPSGESVSVLLYGATVTSWKSASGHENLWLSTAAKLDGSKAVRGGIPVVFPVFGPPPADHATSKLPQHGFARISTWELLGTTGEDAGVRLDFGLGPEALSEEMRAAWPHEFALVYSVTLGKGDLKTVLEVRNPGKESWEFQMLTHTYFTTSDIYKTAVRGLAGVQYADKLQNQKVSDSAGNELPIEGAVDRVYRSLKQDTTSIVVDGKPAYDLVRDNLADVVVWNPWKEGAQSMGDFEPKDGYQHMICVEAGSVSSWQTLEGSDGFEAGQVIKSHL